MFGFGGWCVLVSVVGGGCLWLCGCGGLWLVVVVWLWLFVVGWVVVAGCGCLWLVGCGCKSQRTVLTGPNAMLYELAKKNGNWSNFDMILIGNKTV